MPRTPANGMQRLVRGMLGMPLHWQVWVLLLGVVNGVVPLAFLGRLEARVVLATMLLAGAVMVMLAARFGFSRILGLAHFVWIPMLVWLWGQLAGIPAEGPFGLWLRGVIALDLLSLSIDVTDVVRFVGGEREELVPTG